MGDEPSTACKQEHTGSADKLPDHLEWIRFHSRAGEPIYYFPEAMTLIEFDEQFGDLLAEMESTENSSPHIFPDGYREQVLADLQSLWDTGWLKNIEPPVIPDNVPVRRLVVGNTLKCNLSCTYCYNQFPANVKGVGKQMTVETFRATTEFFERNGRGVPSYELYFIGGEPLVNLRILDEAWKWGESLRARGKDLHIAVTTNATLLSPKVLEFCRERGIGLKVSMDGSNAAEHDRTRVYADGRGSYDKVMRNVRPYLDQPADVEKYVATTVDTLRADLPSRVRGLASLGFNIVDLTELYSPDANDEDREAEELEATFRDSFSGVLDFLAERTAARDYLHVMPIHDVVKRIHQRHPAFFRCRAGGDSFSVSTDGKLYACHHFFGDDEFVLGTVFDDLLPTAALTPYRTPAPQREACSKCWARLLCGGPCFHRSLAASDDAFGISKVDCSRRRALIQESLKFYLRLKNDDPAGLEWFIHRGR